MTLRRDPSIIVHGGAGRIPRDELPERLDGCRVAALAGAKILRQGGTAIDAVEAAVIVLEDNPLFNAGTGSTLNRRGQVETDAALMEGLTLRAGAIAAVRGIRNPIRLARRVMEESRHVLIAGEGALLFAREIGFPECDPETLVVDAERNRWDRARGTVGCVAFDAAGNTAAGTSTGGIFNKLPGRVGDSPLIGCGTCAGADGAVSCTGDGEEIIRIVMAKATLGFLERGMTAAAAASAAVEMLANLTGGSGGLILVDRHGEIGYARNTERMPVCLVRGSGEPRLDA
jgi:beta-aspartyl-peptidase (threonine type)